jgi:hypothetical protein
VNDRLLMEAIYGGHDALLELPATAPIHSVIGGGRSGPGALSLGSRGAKQHHRTGEGAPIWRFFVLAPLFPTA